MQDLSVTELAHGLSIVEPIMRDTLHQIMQYADDAKQAYQNSIKANEQHKEEIMNTLKHATDEFCKGKENLLKISDTLYDLINANKCSSKISEKMLGQIEEKIGHLNKKVQSMADQGLAGMKKTAMVPVKIEVRILNAVAYAHDEIKRDPRALNGRVSVRASEEPRVKKRSLRVIEENDKILLSSASEFDGYKREEVAKSETPGPKAILSEEERVVVIRFGHDWDPTCMRMDEVLFGIAEKVKNFAVFLLAHYDRFGNWKQQQDNWALEDKKEMIDIVEVVYRGAKKGRGLVITRQVKY
ncbi:mitosis protein DIM1-domain-containing protein [Chytridium lagenaria]|nr:mitosis protein DIM1-domain-containing protein [Chytridium lagenaria]